MLNDAEITRLRQAEDAAEADLEEARRNLGAAQLAYAWAQIARFLHECANADSEVYPELALADRIVT